MDMISILNTAFIICLSGAILFFVISVALFFVFDIKTIYMIRSGRAQAKTVKEMQDANTSTGRLRVGKTTQTSGLKKGKKTSKTEKTPVVQPPQQFQTEQSSQENYGGYSFESERITEQLSDNAVENPVAQPAFDDASETSILSSAAETSVLNQMDDDTYESYADSTQTTIYFDIIKKIIVRDTDEVIR